MLRRMNIYKLIKYAQIGDNEAMGMILEKFEPMAKSVSAKYYGTWADFEDFVQVGFVGLIQAVYNYKETSNTKFSTFAYLNISSEIKSFITYLNRQKNKVLTEAIDIDNTLDDSSENGESFFETGEDEFKNILVSYIIDSSIETLKDDEKEMINLWRKGYSYSEISKKLKIKNKKIDNTIQKLKKILSKKESVYYKVQTFFGGGK
ncbi:sigma-70 family RNA polymerase sigma factor [Tepiditoga spiralis]|nr:sigma-70 family RNA polymerase sigma factor [Tepiditoga spiralis]